MIGQGKLILRNLPYGSVYHVRIRSWIGSRVRMSDFSRWEASLRWVQVGIGIPGESMQSSIVCLYPIRPSLLFFSVYFPTHIGWGQKNDI